MQYLNLINAMIQKRFSKKPTKPSLSPDFATNMIEKESELDRACTVDIINDLVQLYTDAIEYFSFIRDRKSADFQEKMHKMFLRPDVINALRLKTQSPIKAVTMQERKQESEQKKQETVVKTKELIESQKDKELNRIFDYQKLRNIETARKAATDFKLQDGDLTKRLASRRKSMLTKSMESFRYLNNSTHSALGQIKEENEALGTSFIKFVVEEEEDEADFEQLEKIMDKYCMEKAKKSAQIQLKYEAELSQFEGHGPLYDQIRLQLKKDMQTELLTLTNEIEMSKSEEIHISKSRHRKNSISYS